MIQLLTAPNDLLIIDTVRRRTGLQVFKLDVILQVHLDFDVKQLHFASLLHLELQAEASKVLLLLEAIHEYQRHFFLLKPLVWQNVVYDRLRTLEGLSFEVHSVGRVVDGLKVDRVGSDSALAA